MDTYNWRIYLYSAVIYLAYLFFHWQRTRDRKWTISCGHVWLENSCFVSLWLIPGHIFSETWMRMAVEVPYIFYSYVFGLYFISLTTMTTKHDHRCHWNNSVCLFYYIIIHTSQIFTIWTKIQGYYIKQSILRTWIIFRFFLYVEIIYLLWIKEDVGICWNNIQT